MRKFLLPIFIVLGLFCYGETYYDGVVAIVDSVIIPYSQLHLQAVSTAAMMGKQNDTLYIKNLEKDLIWDMVLEEMLYLEGREDTTIKISDIQVNDAVDNMYKQMVASFGSEEMFLKSLKEEGMTLRDWRKSAEEKIRKNMVIQSLMQKKYNFSFPEVPEWQIDSFIKMHRDSLFNNDNRLYSISAISFYVKPSKEEYDSVLNLAKIVKDSIDKGALEFNKGVLIYSADTATFASGGLIGTQPLSRWASLFGKNIISLPVDSTGIFISNFGVHIVKKDNISPEGKSATLRHILFRVPITSKDSLNAIKKGEEIIDEYKKGVSFDSLSVKYSEDAMLKQKRGFIGILSGASLPISSSDFYNTGISNPIYMGEIVPSIVIYHIDKKESDSEMQLRIREAVKNLLKEKEKKRIYDIIRDNLLKNHYVEVKLN